MLWIDIEMRNYLSAAAVSTPPLIIYDFSSYLTTGVDDLLGGGVDCIEQQTS